MNPWVNEAKPSAASRTALYAKTLIHYPSILIVYNKRASLFFNASQKSPKNLKSSHRDIRGFATLLSFTEKVQRFRDACFCFPSVISVYSVAKCFFRLKCFLSTHTQKKTCLCFRQVFFKYFRIRCRNLFPASSRSLIR